MKKQENKVIAACTSEGWTLQLNYKAELKDMTARIVHPGTCGVCTVLNVCRVPLKRQVAALVKHDGKSRSQYENREAIQNAIRSSRKICDSTGRINPSICAFFIARCEAFNNNNTIITSQPLRSK